jgi:cytochrome c biogenesis protein CcmG/thiol:disulfide interchange protein DsbE
VRRFLLVTLVMVGLASCGGGRSLARDATLPVDRLALPDYDHERYRALLATLKGKPLVVNFWGSWCPPCRDEAPHLAELAREYDGTVQFLGVDIVDDKPSAREFILEFDWPYPSIFDPRDTIRTELGLIGQPITIVYDAEGRTAWTKVGATDADELREHLEAVL